MAPVLAPVFMQAQVEIPDGFDWPLSRVNWPTQTTKRYGGFIGYGNLLRSVQQCIIPDESSDIGFLISDPFKYAPDSKNRVNIVLSMWEHMEVPLDAIRRLRAADAVIVPSMFCKRMFEDCLDCPVYYVPLSIDSSIFTYKRRKKPVDQPFRWLWINAPDMRKGYDHLARIWEQCFFNNPNAELYMKTTSNVKEQILRMGNVTYDSRYLSQQEIVDLYHSAHGFVYLSWGEGFGYTIAEAMATGLPCVATDYSGYTDFFNKGTGYPLDYKTFRVERELRSVGAGDVSQSHAPDGKYTIAIGDSQQCIKTMDTVMAKYSRALDRGKRASRLIDNKMNIYTMAGALKKIFDRYQ